MLCLFKVWVSHAYWQLCFFQQHFMTPFAILWFRFVLVAFFPLSICSNLSSRFFHFVISLQDMCDYGSPQFPVSCCSQQYLLIYYFILSLWHLFLHLFVQICQVGSLSLSYPFKICVIMALHAFLSLLLISVILSPLLPLFVHLPWKSAF